MLSLYGLNDISYKYNITYNIQKPCYYIKCSILDQKLMELSWIFIRVCMNMWQGNEFCSRKRYTDIQKMFLLRWLFIDDPQCGEMYINETWRLESILMYARFLGQVDDHRNLKSRHHANIYYFYTIYKNLIGIF